MKKNNESVNSNSTNIQFSDLFNLDDIQNIQDLFSDATGVASIITNPDGTPITKPSNFCRLCIDIIRNTEKGQANCFKSDAALGKYRPTGPLVQPCLSGGLWDAGASITVGGYHIANWLIGQVRNEELNEKRMIDYADEIGANRAEFMEALNEVPIMSVEQFNKVSKMLFAFANELSEKAYKNLLLKLEMSEREKAIEKLIDNQEKYRMFIDLAADAFFQGDSIGNFIEVNHSALELTGYSREELLKMNIKDLFLPETLSANRLRYDLLSQGEKITAEREVIRKDGRKIFVEMNSKKMPDGTYQSFFRDITERKKAEDAIKSSEARLNRAQEIAHIGNWELDIVNNIFTSSNEGLRLFGFQNGYQPKFSEVSDLILPEDRPFLTKVFTNCLLNGEPYAVEFKIAKKDIGEIRTIISRGEVQRNSDGVIISIIGTNQDITERKQNEEMLRISEEKFRLAFKTSPESININRLSDGMYIDINEGFTAITGYTVDDVIGKTSLDIDIWENPKDRAKLVAGLIENGRVDNLEAKFRMKDGTIINGLMSASVINLNNEPHIISMTTDITERVRAQEALSNSLSMLNASLESTADGILVVNKAGIISRYNQKFVNMWHIPNELFESEVDEVVLNHCTNQLIDPDSFKSKVYELYQYPEKFSFEQFSFTDGRIFERYSQPQKINKEIVGRVWSFRDITERKRAEEALIIAKEKAEESDRLKTAFLANMSHEIRTPMNGILGFANLLKEQNLTDEDHDKYVLIIERSGMRMLNIINDIIDISKIEAGLMEVNLAPVLINEKIEYLLNFFTPEVEEKGIQFTYNNSLPSEEAIIITDGEKVNAVLTNLIKNAIKFTDYGAIEFGYNLKGNNDISEIEFFVKDTGTGISKEQQGIIFKRFRQGSESLSRNYEGAGLGLAISKAYVESLGGKIWVESEPNKGSTFYFTIPYLIDMNEISIDINNILIRSKNCD